MNIKKTLAIVLSMILILFVIAIVALGAISSLKVYVIRDDTGATLFWRADEAYLFLGSGHTGYRFSYLEYAWALVNEYFNDPPSPADYRASASLIRVTPSAVERHVIDFGAETPSTTGFLTPFDDGFYAMCSGGVLCKWDVNGVRLATEEEQRRHDGTNRLFRGDINNQTINGWSVRQLRRLPSDHFEVQVGDKLVIAAKNRRSKRNSYEWVSVINLLRPGQPPESLYDVDGTPRTVSQTEYERTFPKH